MSAIPMGWTKQHDGSYSPPKGNLRDLPPSEPFEGLERELHDQIEADLKSRRWMYHHSRMDRPTTGQVGFPDFTVFPGSGKVFFAEIKTKHGKLSPEQRAWQYCAEILGYEYNIVRSMTDWQNVANSR